MKGIAQLHAVEGCCLDIFDSVAVCVLCNTMINYDLAGIYLKYDCIICSFCFQIPCNWNHCFLKQSAVSSDTNLRCSITSLANVPTGNDNNDDDINKH